ncbi:MAG: hypothetical protein RLZZ312_1614, partial [Bacteroidota bacterium]
MKKYILKTSKIIGYILITFIGIFLLLVISLQIPAVQNFAKNKVVTFVQNKIKTKIIIDRIEIGLPKFVILEGAFVEDQQKKVLLSAKKIKVDISLLELISNKIEISSVDLQNVQINLLKNKNEIFNFDYILKAFESPTKPKDDSPPMAFSIDRINFDKIKFKFIDETSKTKLAVDLNHFDAKIKTFDLNKQLIEIDKLHINKTFVSFILDKNLKIKTPVIEKSAPNHWKLKIEDAILVNINFVFDDNNKDSIVNGIDFSHLKINNLNLQANDFAYNSKIISGKIKSFSVLEKSGLIVENLKTNFFYGQQKAFLKELYFKTPQTLLQKNIEINYNSIADLSKNIQSLNINAKFEDSKIAIKDILLISPILLNQDFFKANKTAILNLNTIIVGKISDLQIPNFELSGIGKTTVSMSGKIIGLPDFKKSFFDLKVKNIQTTANDFNDFVPKNTIPKNISIPKKIILKADFFGKIDDFKTNLKLFSSLGNVFISNARFNNQRKNNEKYVAQTEFFDFDLGKLINNKSLGKISLKAKVNGNGFNPKTLKTNVDGTISKFYYNQYTFQNLQLNATASRRLFNAKAISKDKNFDFVLLSNGSFRNKYPKAKLHLDITYADLQKVKLYNQPMKIRGKLLADIETADIDFLNGKISLNQFTLANATDQFLLDSIKVNAVSTSKNKSIKLKSQFANAELSGNYKLSEIANSLQKSISKYYKLNTKKKIFVDKSQNFSFNVLIKESPILLKLFPIIKAIEPITIAGRYNAVNDSIVVNGYISKLIYNNYNITNAILKINKKHNALIYNFFVDDFQASQFQLPHTTLFGKLEDNVLDYNLQIKDLKDVDRYYIAGKLKTSNAISEIILDPTRLLLNYENWNISDKNSIKFGKNI